MVRDLLKCSVILMCLITDISSSNSEPKYNRRCELLLSKYGIDPELKSSSGWSRVCNNNKLYLYTPNIINDIDRYELCECLTRDSGSRTIEVFKGGKK